MRRIVGITAPIAVATLHAPAAWAQVPPEQAPAVQPRSDEPSHAQPTAEPQATEPSPDAASAGNDIVVTGSRLVSNGNASPTPLTVVGQQQLNLAAPTNISEGLAQIPQFRSSGRPSSYVSSQTATGSYLNLRGLGQNRVLVLFDGRRLVPTTQDGRLDVNTLPELLVRRVDIVTGGASAAYGSDAVAGVVNFVLDDTFSGVKGDIGTGVSTRGDNFSYKARVALGHAFLDDRLRVVASFDYYKAEGVLTTQGRDWDAAHYNVIANPTFATDGRTAFLWRSGVTGAQFATGGVITAGPLRGTQFLPGGVPAPFTYGTEVSAGTMVGGDGYWNSRGNLSAPTENRTVYGHVGFDASDSVQLWAEGSHAASDVNFLGTALNYSGTTALTIYRDNAYLDDATRRRMIAANVNSFTMGLIAPQWGRNVAVSNSRVTRGAAGFKADLGKRWQVDGSFDIGHTDLRLESNHSPNQTNFFEALDAVVNPATGQIVCRSALFGATDGCVPLDPFGGTSASAGALNYIFGDATSDTDIDQINGELNLRGSLFRTWAGDVAFAAGYAGRRLSAEQVPDALSQTPITAVAGTRGLPASLVGKVGVFLTGSQSYQQKRSITVHEGFAEVQVPLAKDVPFFQSLDVNGAVRYADYSTTGGVWSWKLGGSWEPADWLRFRVTRSRDVRAPNIPELFAPPLGLLTPLNDPVRGTNNNIVVYTSGNAGLQPEIANTLTVGAVFRPAFVPGLSASVDFYDIKINNAIGALTAQNVVNLCAGGSTSYCGYVNRLVDNTLASVSVVSLNQNVLVDRGVDVELNYSRQILGLRTTFRGLVSYLDSLATTDPFGTVTENAGVNGGEVAGTPHWQGSASLSLASGGTTLFGQMRVIGGGLYSNLYVVGGRASNSIDYNHVDGRTYFDLTLSQRIEAAGKPEFYLTVNNLLDRDPPPSPTRIGSPASILGTNPTLYDVIGRQFTMGVRFNF